MKHLIVAILAFGSYGHIIAQSNLMKNIVFVKNAEEHGVGLVIGQEDDITYIITAFHVVEDAMVDTLTEITVYSYDKATQWTATILSGRVDIDRDIVCLTIRSGNYKFHEIPVSWDENATEDTPLFIIGKMKEKEILTYIRRISFSKNKDEMKFIVDDIHYEIQPGCSGSPVFSTDERFKGMVLAKDKTEVTCLKLSSIKAFIEKGINHNLLIKKTLPPEKFVFRNIETNFFLSADGSRVLQSSIGRGCQAYYLEPIGNKYVIHCNENNCLVDNSTRNSGPANFGPCNSTDYRQQWLLNTVEEGLIMFENVSTGRFITVSHAGEGLYKEGTLMEMWYDLRGKGHGAPNSQKWRKIQQ